MFFQVVVLGGETVNAGCNRSEAVGDVEIYANGHSPVSKWVVEERIPANRFRFIGASHKEQILLFGGQGSWTLDLDGNGNPGYPILSTTVRYQIPGSTTIAAATTVAAATTKNTDSGAAVIRGSGLVTLAVAWCFAWTV